MVRPVLLGNSGSPRWYEGDPARLDAYLALLVESGATSAEMVLHHGDADERTARVHVLEPDWLSMIERYRMSGIAVQLHVSLDHRFMTDRWADDPEGLAVEYRPLLELLGQAASDQSRAVLVLHAAGDRDRSEEANLQTTIGLLNWLANELERYPEGAIAALELGAWKATRPTAAGRSRESVLEAVTAVESRRVGICWDLAHDRENGARDALWQPVPQAEFLQRVAHVHLHDLSTDLVSHYPLVLGNVPFPDQLAALAVQGPLPSITMEIRWRCAAQFGEPWEMLRQSYHRVLNVIGEINASG